MIALQGAWQVTFDRRTALGERGPARRVGAAPAAQAAAHPPAAAAEREAAEAAKLGHPTLEVDFSHNLSDLGI